MQQWAELGAVCWCVLHLQLATGALNEVWHPTPHTAHVQNDVRPWACAHHLPGVLVTAHRGHSWCDQTGPGLLHTSNGVYGLPWCARGVCGEPSNGRQGRCNRHPCKFHTSDGARSVLWPPTVLCY